MNKEYFLVKWGRSYTPAFESDLDALIAHEIAKGQESKPQPTLNPIEEAYERGEKIRHKNWLNGDWIQKHKETKTIDNHGNINSVYPFAFIQYPEKWEIYTEPAEQPTPKQKITPTDDDIKNGLQKLGDIIAKPNPTEQPTKPFDKDRFERMFRAVVASGRTESYEQDFLATNICLEKLDAYYASKEGGANG